MKLPLDAHLSWRETVGVTGNGPHDTAVIEKVATLEGAIVGDMERRAKPLWCLPRRVVVGSSCFVGWRSVELHNAS